MRNPSDNQGLAFQENSLGPPTPTSKTILPACFPPIAISKKHFNGLAIIFNSSVSAFRNIGYDLIIIPVNKRGLCYDRLPVGRSKEGR